MSKSLLLLSLLALIILGIGTAIAPNNTMFWLASGATTYQYVRLGLAAVLILQLMTDPPRHIWFRVLAGTAAAITGIWVIQQSYGYHMAFLDTLAYLGAALAVFITALERKAPVFTVDVMNAKGKQLASQSPGV